MCCVILQCCHYRGGTSSPNFISADKDKITIHELDSIVSSHSGQYLLIHIFSGDLKPNFVKALILKNVGLMGHFCPKR